MSIEDAASMLGISSINLRRYLAYATLQDAGELSYTHLEEEWMKTIPIHEILDKVYHKYLI